MRRGLLLVGVSAAVAIAAACSSPDTEGPPRSSIAAPDAAPLDPTTAFTPEQMRAYMRLLAPYLVSRELDAAELGLLDNEKFGAIRPMLTAWTKEPAFPKAARRVISQKLSVSGTRDNIDFDLPGNLAEHVVKEGLPFSTILTADYCIDAKGAKRECDTGAPFKAGVLATRAFMASRASRFNLTRASTIMRTFACVHYPMAEKLQPRIEKTRLIPMFQVEKALDDAGTENDAFGNGSACYSCHSQFSLHAQIFVRFDETGMYQAAATGLQDPKGELGRSEKGLFASHLANAMEAKEEKSQVFGKEVAHLGEAAKVMAESETFVPCQVDNLLQYALRLPATIQLDPEVMEVIAKQSRTAGDPTFATLVIETFAHPRVVAAVTFPKSEESEGGAH